VSIPSDSNNWRNPSPLNRFRSQRKPLSSNKREWKNDGNSQIPTPYAAPHLLNTQPTIDPKRVHRIPSQRRNYSNFPTNPANIVPNLRSAHNLAGSDNLIALKNALKTCARQSRANGGQKYQHNIQRILSTIIPKIDTSLKHLSPDETIAPNISAEILWSLCTLRARSDPQLNRLADYAGLVNTLINRSLPNIESYSSKNIAQTLWVLASWKLNLVEALDALGRRATAIIDEFDSCGLMNIGWAYAIFRHFNKITDSLFLGIALVAAPKLSRFLSFETTVLAWAFGRRKKAEEPILIYMRTLSQMIQSGVFELETVNISQLCKAFSYLEIKDVLLFKYLAIKIVAKIHDVDHQSIANILSSYADLRIVDEDLFRKLSQKAYAKRSTFPKQEMAQVVMSLADSQFENAALFTAIANDYIAHPYDYEEKETSIIARAFAKMKKNPYGFFAEVSNHYKTRFMLNFKAISSIAWVFATINKKDAQLFQRLGTSAISKLKEMSHEELSQLSLEISSLTWSFAKLQIKNEMLFLTIARITPKVFSHCKPRSCATLYWSYSALGFKPENIENFLITLENRYLEMIDEADHQSISMMFNSLENFNRHRRELIDPLLSHGRKKIADFNPGEIEICFNALASLGIKDKKLFQCVADTISQAEIDDYEPKNLANLLFIFANLELTDMGLFHLFRQACIKKASDFNEQDIANALWAFSFFGSLNTELLQSLLLRKKPLYFREPDARRLKYVYLHTQFVNRLPFQWPKNAIEAISKAKIDFFPPSHVEKEIFAHLKKYRKDCKNQYTIENIVVPMTIPAEKIIIQAVETTSSPLKTAAWKKFCHQLLEMMGWKIVEISEREWSAHSSSPEKRECLEKKGLLPVKGGQYKSTSSKAGSLIAPPPISKPPEMQVSEAPSEPAVVPRKNPGQTPPPERLQPATIPERSHPNQAMFARLNRRQVNRLQMPKYSKSFCKVAVISAVSIALLSATVFLFVQTADEEV